MRKPQFQEAERLAQDHLLSGKTTLRTFPQAPNLSFYNEKKDLKWSHDSLKVTGELIRGRDSSPAGSPSPPSTVETQSTVNMRYPFFWNNQ